jgi:methionyl-tRNA formyltransferase
MKIVFMGTPEFAVASLDTLIQGGYNIVAVVTAPDKPAGRGQILQQSAVKRYALENELTLIQPVNLKDHGFLNELKTIGADLQVVVAFRMLPEQVWNMPRLGTYNLHASLLPKYRGAAPINWALINGEKETGVSTFKLRHEIDSGLIVLQNKQEIGPLTTAGELHDQLMVKGADLMLKTVKMIESFDQQKKELPFILQDETQVSHAPKINKETCRINWNQDYRSIHNLIRGLSPFPGAFTFYASQGEAPVQFKLFLSDFEAGEHAYTNGTLITENGKSIKVACSGGFVRIKELQVQGKRRMDAESFLKGYRFRSNAQFD